MFSQRWGERRREPRNDSSELARILLNGELSRPYQVLDHSKGGLRLAISGKPELPQRFVVEMLLSGELIPVAIAWQKLNEVGLKRAFPKTI